MYKYFTKRRIYIGLFTILYLMVSLTSLIHSFAFFGLANNTLKSILLGCAFEIGQVAVLMSLLTSKKEQSRVMPWVLMSLLTVVQIVGNIFSSYKYMMLHSIGDLKYFKEPIFIWTDLPDNITTVIVTYIVGAILPIICLCMCAMISNYIIEKEEETEQYKLPKQQSQEDFNMHCNSEAQAELKCNVSEAQAELKDDKQNQTEEIPHAGFVNL